MVLSEHWLWPFELDGLKSISDDIDATGKADARLTAEYTGSRGGYLMAQEHWCHPCRRN